MERFGKYFVFFLKSKWYRAKIEPKSYDFVNKILAWLQNDFTLIVAISEFEFTLILISLWFWLDLYSILAQCQQDFDIANFNLSEILVKSTKIMIFERFEQYLIMISVNLSYNFSEIKQQSNFCHFFQVKSNQDQGKILSKSSETWFTKISARFKLDLSSKFYKSC